MRHFFNMPRLMTTLAAGILTTGVAFAAPVPQLKPVAVDPLIKIFRDSDFKGETTATAEVARGEHATFQIVVPALPVDYRDLKCEVTPFTRQQDDAQLDDAEIRYVGYVPSGFSAKKPAKDQLRAAPAMFPDPLLETDSVDVHAGDNQACWISVKIPTDMEPDDYFATSTISAKIYGVETSVTMPLHLKVYPPVVDKTRLNVTNWFQMWHRGDQPMPEKYSDEWWDVMRLYAKDMVAHRQNWARVETLWIIKYGRDANGKLTFDFSDFDKWVGILLDAGMEKIESLQFAWRGGEWKDPYVVEIHDETDAGYLGGKAYKGRRVAVDSPEAEKFYSQWFPAFRNHLKEKGWLDKFVQHVGDEPVKENAESYIKAASYVHKYAPELPVMEACLSHNMVGAIDIWVPTLEHLGKDFDFYKERMKAGDKVWFYTCVQPQGDYANRFVELPLIKTRLLHWINYRYGIDGYLHWGYNFWRPHPWDNIAAQSGLPGGDYAIVYPAKKGYGVIDSIRWEAMRDGIEDHELLSQLGEKDPDAAMALAKRLIKGFDRYDTDVEDFRDTRRELLEALSPK